MTTQNKNQNRIPHGLTIIELLVVVTILAIITAMAIPQLRMINRDRGIREAARTVGSTLAQAVSRAAADGDGVAGILIERSLNVVDFDDATHVGGVNYAGTRLFVTRSVPPFSGDDIGDMATVDGTVATLLTIAAPIEHTLDNPVIRVGDHIRLGYGVVRYQITDVNQVGLNLELTIALGTAGGGIATLPAPAVGATLPFVVYRRPKKLESSQMDLPAGYIVDLRFSGPILSSADLSESFNAGTGPIDEFSNQSAFGQKTTRDVEIIFDESGQINAYDFNYQADDGLFYNSVSNVPLGSMYLFVTAYDPEESNIAPAQSLDSMGNPTPTIEDPNLALFDPDAMWVSIDQRTGAVNVAYNSPPFNDSTFIYSKINAARTLASGKQSANQ